eukprot:scaffold127115_cov23-Cyclotella_meneghiniana.AAC.1
MERIERFNDANALNNLAVDYKEGGSGLSVDRPKAIELFHRASELGSSQAHYNLGCIYFSGDGVAIDRKKAIHHWQIAAMM